jgi:hypothetical protein
MTPYDKLLATIEEIPNRKVLQPRMPIDALLQEAADLHIWAGHDKDALIGVGLSAELVDSLQDRYLALQEAESRWRHISRSDSDEAAQFYQQEKEAKMLRKELIHAFRFAFRSHSDLMTSVRRVTKGASVADLIQDLMDLTVIGRSGAELLKEINFDLTLLDRSERLCNDLSIAKGKYFAGEYEHDLARSIRNRFYTYLLQAVRDIRDAGKYAFRNNPDRLQGYVSKYDQQLNRKRSEQLSD